MRAHATDDDVRDEPRLPVPVDDAPEVRGITAEIVTSRGQPAECTLYPADASGVELMTTWITAREGAFVSRDEMR